MPRYLREGVASAAEGCLWDENSCFLQLSYSLANAEPFQYNEVITAPAGQAPVPWLDRLPHRSGVCSMVATCPYHLAPEPDMHITRIKSIHGDVL